MSQFVASSQCQQTSSRVRARRTTSRRTARALDGRGPARRYIFSIAPEAKGLFPFSRGRQSDEDLYNNLYLKKHGANVVMTVNTAVEGLTDLDALVPVLKGLGKRHVGYGARRPRPRRSDRPRATPRRRQPHT